jgi:hypothetical protein
MGRPGWRWPPGAFGLAFTAFLSLFPFVFLLFPTVGVTRPTVIACRRRYVHRGLDGLSDRPRPGRPQTVRRARRAEILSATLNPPPPRLGITHWSTRLLARELDVSRDTIARVWREYGIQPWRVATFKFSTDPELAAKVHDVVGLYLHPPDRAVVLCVDE